MVNFGSLRRSCLARPGTLAALAMAGAVATGCGASSSEPDATSPSSGTKSALGTPKPATGAPIVLGMVNMEGAAAGSFPDQRLGAQAAVDFVNQYRGGVHGRPLKLVTCIANGDPASSGKCANELLDDKPIAVVGGADLGNPAALPIWSKAKIPFIGGQPFNSAELSSPNSIQFIAVSVGLFSGQAVYIADRLKAKKVSIVYYTIPSGVAAKDAAVAALKAKGITDITQVPQEVTVSDATPAVAAALKNKPDALIVEEAGNTCASVMRARKNLAPNTALFVTGACTDPKTLKTVGAAADGVYLSQDYTSPEALSDPDVKLFRAAMQKYQADAAVRVPSQAGFSSIMNIWAAFNDILLTDLNGDTILKWFRTGEDKPNFMGHPYTCDGRIKIAPAVCNGAQRILVIKDGKAVPVDNQWYDGTSYS
jgi:branched-chain amino acid transport system substrate-binding protein